jgi:hypothetical protein
VRTRSLPAKTLKQVLRGHIATCLLKLNDTLTLKTKRSKIERDQTVTIEASKYGSLTLHNEEMKLKWSNEGTPTWMIRQRWRGPLGLLWVGICLTKGTLIIYQSWSLTPSNYEWLNINLINLYTNHSLYITHLVKGSPPSPAVSVRCSIIRTFWERINVELLLIFAGAT